MRLSAKILTLLLAAFFAIAFTLRAEQPAEETVEPAAEPAFTVGEKLTYSLRWGILRAGIAVLEVHPMVEIDGEEVHHFSLSIRTTPLVDKFYKVRDRIDGFARADMQGSVLYLLKKEEGKNLRDVRVYYDLAENTAQYSNFGAEQDPVEIFPATLDPLSVIFALREHTLREGTEVELPISDGRRASIGVGRVKGTARLTVPAGNYRAVLVEPDMKDVGGVFDKSGDSPMQIWFSDDKRQIPVRISSRVSVGSFRADLVSVEQVPFEDMATVASILVD